MNRLALTAGLIWSLLFPFYLLSQPLSQKDNPPGYDLSRDPVLYTVGYAHLDTEWRWDYPETINKYIKSTLEDNFRYLEKYKEYVFNFSGARRYRMMKEYYPEKYDQLKRYIAGKRWFVAGSSVDECDANIPSPESVIRQVLYGNRYFIKEFGKESVDFMLPDCFGFQSHLPSVLAHCGIKGFSTQKLVWGSAVGIPFNIGRWTGPDGKGVVAALNATDYGGNISPRIDTAKYWVDRVMENGKKYGVFADFRYYGTGDIGGGPEESAIKNGIASLNNPDSRIHVYLSSSDQLFRDLTEEQKSRLPAYSGDLLLTQHSAGSLTSQGYMKRWNRKNELLAQAAEPLAVMADWLGGIPYPTEAFNQAWWLVLGSQMHDILPGTCIPKAYEYAWNDEVLAMNRFAGLLESSAGAVIRAMDTRVQGIPVVVYNPLAIDREDIAEAEVTWPDGAPAAVQVFGPDGTEVAVQVTAQAKSSMHLLFTAKVQSLGMACYDIRPVKKEAPVKTPLLSGKLFLENEYYKVTFNDKGDVTGIIDKKLVREMLSAPARLAFQKEHPAYWPAWNMDWKDRKKPPFAYVEGPARITLTETGPVRITVTIERTALNSVFNQQIRLNAGEAGKRIEFVNQVAWQSKGMSLKASFPLTVSDTAATYNMGFGTIRRSNNNEKKYEVPSREWFDLTDKSGSWGVSVLEDCKFGSDKPDDRTLRLTLLYTPVTNEYHDQATQDWGLHEFTYGLYSHRGDWRAGKTEWQGHMLNQPLRTFQVSSHPGILGSLFSLVRISTPQVDVRAMKKSEEGDAVIIRLQELNGKPAGNVEVSLAMKIKTAWETDGQERKTGDIPVQNGKLLLSFSGYEMKSIALQVQPPDEKITGIASIPLPLVFDTDVFSTQKNRRDGRFSAGGSALPAELYPEFLTIGGVDFKTGGTKDGMKNALACKGQKIALPQTGLYNRIYLLAAATRDTIGIFRTGSGKTPVRIQGYDGMIGQYDRRTWDKLERITGVEPGYIKRDEVAWFATHLHGDTADLPYQYAYIYRYALDASPASGYLQLPENEAIRIFAISLADNPHDAIRQGMPLYDDFSGRKTIDLVTGKRFVTEDMEPAATVKTFRKANLNDLPFKVSLKDYADIHEPNGITARYFYSGTDKQKNMPQQGLTLPGLTDGMFDLLSSDTVNDAWFEAGEGRIVMDLQKAIVLDSLHLFTQFTLTRGAQRFSLWGSEKEKLPSSEGDPPGNGWSYIASVLPVEIWGGGKGIYAVTLKPGKPNRFRYLMWVTEDCSHGPYFLREVDIFEKQ